MSKFSTFFRFAFFIGVFFVAGYATAAAQNQKAENKTGGMANEKLRDIPFPFPVGADLQFLIKELAREIDLNVLFDPESFRSPRKTYIDVKNVTAAEALEYVLLQERLVYEKVGPKTILVSSQYRGNGIRQIGVGVTHLTEQLARYFGVDGGILINDVWSGSPPSTAGLKAGDVIVEIDGVPVRGAVGLINAINDRNGTEIALQIVRDRKTQTINITPEKGIK